MRNPKTSKWAWSIGMGVIRSPSAVKRQLGNVAGVHLLRRRPERIAKALADFALDLARAVERHGPAQQAWNRTQVIETEEMVGVVMGEEDRMHTADAFAQELQPQLGRRIDKDIAFRHAQQDSAPVALVARVGRL